MSNLYTASAQWSTRPDDERFETPEAMRDACARHARESATSTLPFDALRVDVDGGDLLLAGKTDRRATMTHYAFGQLCAQAKSPAAFVRALPATLAAQVLNNRIKTVCEQESGKYDARILFRKDEHLVARAITSELYDRVWNYELIDRGVLPMVNEGWRVPPARPVREGQRGTRRATAADILPNQGDFGLSVREGDMIAPAGLYASDHDMFAFLVHTDRVVKAGNRALMRGVFIRNSEVGDGSLEAVRFLMDNVCGNHIVWGATDVQSVKIRHVARADKIDQGKSLRRFVSAWRTQMTAYSTDAASTEEAKIERAMSFEIGATKDDVIDALFKFARSHALPAITRGRLEAAYKTAVLHEDWYGSPRSAWGMVSGLTENSQGAYTDERDDVDRQSGKLLSIAF